MSESAEPLAPLPARSPLDDFDRGVANRRKVLGDAWVDKSLRAANSFTADFQSLITRYAWHDIWSRPGLDHRTRRLLVMAMTLAQGRWDEFELHVKAALTGGLTVSDIKETLLQAAIYCGVPSANTGFKLALAILKEQGVELEPEPLDVDHRVSMQRTFSSPQLAVYRQGPQSLPEVTSGSVPSPSTARAPVVLCHALGMDAHMWDGLAARLAERVEVLRYDQRGHGQSAAPPGPYQMDDLVDDAARLVREWGQGPVAWVGLSMGGMVGQGLAARHPELVSRLVIANSSAWYPPAARDGWRQRIDTVRAEGIAAVADTVMSRYFHDDFRRDRPDLAEQARATLLRNDPAAYAAACHAVMTVDWRNQLSAIQCPTLVIAGGRDAGAPVAMSEAIVGAIPGALLQVLPNASHISVMEEPEAFYQAVWAFLNR